MRCEESEGVSEATDPEDTLLAGGRRVRLPLCTWQGLLGFIAVMAAGVILVGEDPEQAAKGRREVSLAGHNGLVDTLRFSHDGRMLLSSGWDKTVRIWGIDGPESEFGVELARLSTDTEVFCAAISPDGRTVAVAGLDGLALWDWAEGGAVRSSSTPVGISRSLAFSPDGRKLAVGGYDEGIYLVDVATGHVEAALLGHEDVIRRLAFAADGRRLLSLSYDGRLKTWDVATRLQVEALTGLDDLERPVLTFAVSPDGRDLALSRLHEADGHVEIWDVAAGVRRSTTRGTNGEVHALTFSQDGGVLASCGSDLALRFWDPRTGLSAGVMEGLRGWVRTLDFSADGCWMATSSGPDEVRLRRVGLPRRHVAPATATIEGRPTLQAGAA